MCSLTAESEGVDTRSTAAPTINWRRAAGLTLETLKRDGLLDGATVVLIGSFARDAATWRSDVDILVIGPASPTSRPDVPPMVELHFIEPSQLKRRLDRGDDYAQWVLRFGKLLADPAGAWPGYLGWTKDCPWPSWEAKLPGIRRYLARVEPLLEMGDLDAAAEQALRAADHLARAILLSRKVWPLSRPELADQLSSEGIDDLAATLRRLGEYDTPKAAIETAARIIEQRLAETGPAD